MTHNEHWLTTIAHHEHFVLRWAKNLSKFGSGASEERSYEILNNFPIQMLWGSYECIGKQTWPCRKKVKCQRTTIFLATLVDLLPPWFVHTFSPKASSVLEKKLFKGFYHIWAWRPFWSMNSDHFSNLSLPRPNKAQYEIWANFAQWLQRRSFEILNNFPIQMYGAHTNA